MSLVPGLGIVKGMALTLRRFFEPKVTNLYPEVPAEIPSRFRGRLQLLYDEYGTLKCETCFQCAQACPIECIDMGGHDTKGRFAVHWGAAETYGERREESALRRSGRTVPDPASDHFHGIDPAALDAILDDYDHDPKQMLPILRGRPGSLRPRPGGRPQADQPDDRRLVRDALRDGHLLRPPGGRSARPGRRRAGPGTPSSAPSRARSRVPAGVTPRAARPGRAPA